MPSLSTDTDATANLEWILNTGRNRDGPPGRNAFVQTSTGLPYWSLLSSSMYQCTRENTCCWLWDEMLNKAIHFAWSHITFRTDWAMIVCPGCSYSCRPQGPTFMLGPKLLWTNNNALNRLTVFERQLTLVIISPYIDMYTTSREERSSESKVLSLWKGGRWTSDSSVFQQVGRKCGLHQFRA